MRLRLRLLILALLAMARARIAISASSWIRIRVLPNDVDLCCVSNDRYLAYFDLGRNDLTIRIGMLPAILKLAARPVVKTMTVRYRHRATLFQSLRMRTRLVCWDHDAVWSEQELFCQDRSIALAFCQASLMTRNGVLPLVELLRELGTISPPVPASILNLQSVNTLMQFAQWELTPSL